MVWQTCVEGMPDGYNGGTMWKIGFPKMSKKMSSCHHSGELDVGFVTIFVFRRGYWFCCGR